MNAGLPTTGIGGIFYFLCVISMFFTELLHTVRRRSSVARWKFVMGQVLMLAIMLGMIWISGFVLSKIVPAEARQMIIAMPNNTPIGSSVQTIFLTPFIILGVLLVLTQIFRLYVLLSNKSRVKA